MSYAVSETSGDGNPLVWFILICLMALAIFAAIQFNKNSLGIQCSEYGCTQDATVYMKSPYGTVGAFCDLHSAEKHDEGWRIQDWK